MEERKYQVLIDNTVVASNMDINTAIILIRAIITEYYEDRYMTVSIKEMERTMGVEDEKL